MKTMFVNAVALGGIVGPDQFKVVFEYWLPLTSFTKYSTRATVVWPWLM